MSPLKPRSKDPSEFWTVSTRYHFKTGRPGFVMSVIGKNDEGKKVEKYVAHVPGQEPTIFPTKREAADWVIIWRCMNGYDDRGKKQ